VRDLALFKVARDTCFRGSDLVRLRVADVATPLGMREIIDIRQKKTEARNARPMQARLSAVTHDSLQIYPAARERPLHSCCSSVKLRGGSQSSERKPALAVGERLVGPGPARPYPLWTAFPAPDPPDLHLSIDRQFARRGARGGVRQQQEHYRLFITLPSFEKHDAGIATSACLMGPEPERLEPFMGNFLT